MAKHKRKHVGCYYVVNAPGRGTGHDFKSLRSARAYAKKRSKGKKGDMNIARECLPGYGKPGAANKKTLVRCRKGTCYTQAAWEAGKRNGTLGSAKRRKSA